jgi:hypothetical protein
MSILNRFTVEQWKRHNADYAASIDSPTSPVSIELELLTLSVWHKHPIEYTIPNRLHGAAINAEGDAI